MFFKETAMRQSKCRIPQRRPSARSRHRILFSHAASEVPTAGSLPGQQPCPYIKILRKRKEAQGE
ncbi:hypothetical protein [Phocaeicola sartorii]|uniref:hypothetical protein n=1 Tax=Phocaeicola sartorii TaxID=671267 RepID=UPI00272CB14E|nr:hypothetical protein [Phocaeicola sartorii]